MVGRLAGACLISTFRLAYADRHAEAVALFDQGIRDMQANRFDQACSELAASLAKYSDSGTKGALAECYAHQHKTVSAWKLWKELADTEKDVDLRADAAKNAELLEPTLPRYVLNLRATTPGLSISINDETVASPIVAVPLPIDAGRLVVTASAPGFETWTHGYEAVAGQTVAIEIPELEQDTRRQSTTKHHEAPAPAPGRTPNWSAWAAGGGAVTALGIAVGFALAGNSKWDDAKVAGCKDDGGCPASAQPLGDRANLLTEIAIGATVVGVGLGVVSGYLFLKDQPRMTVGAITVNGGAIGVIEGRF